MDHNKLWKILREMRIPDHLTCLLRNLYAGQEATVRTKTWKNTLAPYRKRTMSRLYIVTLLIRVKRLPAMRETQVRSLSWDVPLEKEMAPHSSTLAWKIP